MTASRVAPASACVQRTMEPLLSLPKSTLISRFRLEGSTDTLLVGNIHAVNFTLGTEAFRSQLGRLASMLDEHDNLTEAEIRDGLGGNICRCTGYTSIVEALDIAGKVTS